MGEKPFNFASLFRIERRRWLQDSSSRCNCVCVRGEKKRREEGARKKARASVDGKTAATGRPRALSLSLSLASSSSSFLLSSSHAEPKERHNRIHSTTRTQRSRPTRALAPHASPKQNPRFRKGRETEERARFPRRPPTRGGGEQEPIPLPAPPLSLHKRFSFLPTNKQRRRRYRLARPFPSDDRGRTPRCRGRLRCARW